MTSDPLPNYLRPNRKRLGLFQGDVAFLLGVKHGEAVCRMEQFVRTPSLDQALAYEAIYGKPVRELFPGVYARAAEGIAARVDALAEELRSKTAPGAISRKRQILTDLANRLSNKSDSNL
jgi:transcriptional regulator with XRE-family HTH domain